MARRWMDRIQARLELFRLEQRYTRHRHRRSTFVSNAVYVDGEYVYQSPSSTGSFSDSSTHRVGALHGDRAGSGSSAPYATQVSETGEVPTPTRNRLHRLSSLPGLGALACKERAQVMGRRLSMMR